MPKQTIARLELEPHGADRTVADVLAALDESSDPDHVAFKTTPLLNKGSLAIGVEARSADGMRIKAKKAFPLVSDCTVGVCLTNALASGDPVLSTNVDGSWWFVLRAATFRTIMVSVCSSDEDHKVLPHAGGFCPICGSAIIQVPK